MDLTFDFTVNKENNTISVVREFYAELSLVWDAYTKSEILDQWWAPNPWRAETKSMDFKEGGRWHYAMCGPSGEKHWAFMTYQKIEFQKVFTGVEGFTDENGIVNNELPQSTWEVSFLNKGDTTIVTTHILFDSLEQLEAIIKMGFKEGYTMAMENLDEVLEMQNQS